MTGRQDVFQQAMNQGHSAAWDQLWDHAATFYRQALGEFPNHPKALTSLGLALLRLQHFEEALVYYQRASKILPEDPLPVENVAQIYERMGRIGEAIQASMRAADLYLKKNDAERAIENWVRITRFDPENLRAHSYLAVVYERQGRKNLAVTEYLIVASLVQRAGDKARAAQAVDHALQLSPENAEARKAFSLLQANQPLPRPARSKVGTGELLLAQSQETKAKASPTQASAQDPIAAARQRALFQLAEVLFEKTEETEEEQTGRPDMDKIIQGAGAFSPEQTERAKIILHLGQAIDAQTQNQELRAAEELEQAIDAGLVHPAAYFDLGMLRAKTDTPDTALRSLQLATKHTDFALAGNLILGKTLRQLGLLHEAAMAYLEALRIADAATVPAEQADELRQLYDPILEMESKELDEKSLADVCRNLDAQLVRPEWREHLLHARQQLPPQPEGNPPMPLAEILLNTHSSQVIESVSKIRALAGQGNVMTAIEEAYYALPQAPTYLPLHVQIGELLLQDQHPLSAAEKFLVVSRVFEVRGEIKQAVRLLKRVSQLNPGDETVPKHLIDLMLAEGQVEEAIQAYMDLADLSYRLGELDAARKDYIDALALAEKIPSAQPTVAKILANVGDIDIQRLDLRQAVKMFEQLRRMQPEDEKARANLVDLHFRLHEDAAGLAEVDNYVSLLAAGNQWRRAASFLEGCAQNWPESAELYKRLGKAYQQSGQRPQAVEAWNTAADLLTAKKDHAGAMEALQTILTLDPPDSDSYRERLENVQRSLWGR
ncbi:MAG TPA: tetratricopeptide repeat protein [Anaerolineaceae bacterium]|nr:tetratricopeptide repeat protein [Anaerolineaceae bacterium]